MSTTKQTARNSIAGIKRSSITGQLARKSIKPRIRDRTWNYQRYQKWTNKKGATRNQDGTLAYAVMERVI